MQGYKGVWDANGTLLRCLEAGPQTPTAIIVGVVAAAAVLIIALLAWLQYLTTRPRWLRERILQVCQGRVCAVWGSAKIVTCCGVSKVEPVGVLLIGGA